ncbi:MAG: hypothetical protein Q9170_001623 [Blastenia crenularia]
MGLFIVTLLLWSLAVTRITSRRLEPTEPYAPPLLVKDISSLRVVFEQLEAKIQHAAKSESSPWRTNITSFSIAVTSASENLWTTSHTASVLGNYTDSTPTAVSDQTYFRIASISKVFTVLAVLLQQQAGKWSLHDSITKFVPELLEGETTNKVNWESITLETLASQLSGIPREYGQSDLVDPFEDRQYGFEDPVDVGLPPVDGDDVPPCGENRPHTRPCTRKELLDGLIKRPPVYQPNARATYSNMAFVLLGFALEAVSGLSYEKLVDLLIFNPIGMNKARLSKPPDSQGVIPDQTNDWDAHIGTYGPTGGIYTTASDLALFARSVLNNKLLDRSATNAWLKPHSYSESLSFAYGMPWEIFRTRDLLPDSDRIQTIITKAGGLRGYTSQLLLIPEYDLGLVVFVAGDGHALAWLRDEILKALLPIVEGTTRDQTASGFSGTYKSTDTHINSSISIEVQGPSGLVITSWISNATDFLARYVSMSTRAGGVARPGKVQLTSAGTRRGATDEVWRAQFVPDQFPSGGVINMGFITDVDTFTYAARSVEEFVFEIDASGQATAVTLPAFRIKLKRQQQQQQQKEISTGVIGNALQKLMRPLNQGYQVFGSRYTGHED